MFSVLDITDQSVMSAALVESVIAWLQRAALKPAVAGGASDAERIDRITQLERLKAVSAAVQARETAAFAVPGGGGVGVAVPSRGTSRSTCGAASPGRSRWPGGNTLVVVPFLSGSRQW